MADTMTDIERMNALDDRMTAIEEKLAELLERLERKNTALRMIAAVAEEGQK